jgi:hypothetical protein
MITVDKLKTFIFPQDKNKYTCTGGNNKSQEKSNTEIVSRLLQGCKILFL